MTTTTTTPTPTPALIYSAFFLTDSARSLILDTFQAAHGVVFAHHCTVAFRPAEPIVEGLHHRVRAIGRLTTDKVECLVIDPASYFGCNNIPHITLSCAEGVRPVVANSELAVHYDQIDWFHTPIVLETVTGNFRANSPN